MTMNEFRINHSKLIEQYQLIEHHLEGLIGIAQKGDFEELTKRVENDTLGELIRKVNFIFKELKITLLDKEDFALLDEIRFERNFWCHQCYLDIMEDKCDDIGDKVLSNLEKTTKMNEKLRDTFKTLM